MSLLTRSLSFGSLFRPLMTGVGLLLVTGVQNLQHFRHEVANLGFILKLMTKVIAQRANPEFKISWVAVTRQIQGS